MIYYFLDETVPLYALLVYAKGERTDMTSDERRAVASLAEAIKAAARKERG